MENENVSHREEIFRVKVSMKFSNNSKQYSSIYSKQSGGSFQMKLFNAPLLLLHLLNKGQIQGQTLWNYSSQLPKYSENSAFSKLSPSEPHIVKYVLKSTLKNFQ